MDLTETSPFLVDQLRALGDRYGARGVAETAAQLAQPTVMRVPTALADSELAARLGAPRGGPMPGPHVTPIPRGEADEVREARDTQRDDVLVFLAVVMVCVAVGLLVGAVVAAAW